MKHFFSSNGTHLIGIRDFRVEAHESRLFSGVMECEALHCMVRGGAEAVRQCFIIHEDGTLFECDATLTPLSGTKSIHLVGTIHLQRVSFSAEKIQASIEAARHTSDNEAQFA
jgi:hypothetical protein